MEIKTNDNLNERIKSLRKKMGVTQLELAEKLHVTDKAVSKWETGEGNPEITILIELANIFNVSIDYLLTGKEKEPEIIVMSKIELCCKNDNVEMFETINVEAIKIKDETGKTIIDYIEKYDSKKVFMALVTKFSASKLLSSDFKIFDSSRVLKLFYKYDDLESLISLGVFDHNMSRDNYGDIISSTRYGVAPIRTIYNQKNLEEIVDGVSENSIVINHILTIHQDQLINAVADWQSVYTNLLMYALNNEKAKITSKVLHLIFEINDKAIEDCSGSKENVRSDEKNNYKFATKPTNIISSNYRTIYNYAVVALPVSVISLLIEKGYLSEATKINEYNAMFKAEMVSSGLIKSKFLEKEGKASKKEIYITSCLEYGILNIDKIVASNDYKLIKETFETYPICLKEFLMKLFDEKKYRELYEFAIDHDFDFLADDVMCVGKLNNDTKSLKDRIMNIEKCKTIPSYFNINSKYFSNTTYYASKVGVYNKSELDKAPIIKEYILNDLSLKIDKEKLTKGLTKEYFEELIIKGDVELLVIKLCVKLEAILKCDYKYEGTFEEMLSKFTSAHGYEDDGWGYSVESRRTILFHKLRKYRNGIVHPEQAKEALTVDELKSLIKYVCELG